MLNLYTLQNNLWTNPCRYGRKTTLIYGLILSSVMGMIQSFSVNYTMFVLCEFLAAATSAAIYPAAFILGIEWAGTEHRVIMGSLITLTYSFGLALCAIFAAYSQDFRLFLRLVYIPGFVTAAIMLFGAESMRWLLIKGKHSQIEKILKTASAVNECTLSARTMHIVHEKCEQVKQNGRMAKKTDENTSHESLRKLFATKSLCIRFVLCALIWMSVIFVSYGVSIISVSLHGNKYVNFIIISMGSLPAAAITVILLKYVGRVRSLSICLLLTAGCIIVAKLLPNDHKILPLLLFLAAKCFISVNVGIVYIQTTELWPTPLRHTMMGLSSTIGRVGSILAPLTPLLVCNASIDLYILRQIIEFSTFKCYRQI